MFPRGFTLKPTTVWNVTKVAASYALSRALRVPIVWGRPVSSMIEPISRCNYQCPLCPIGAGQLKRELGTMTPDNFVRILDNLGPQVRTLALWNQGEPTINDQLPQMIRLAHDRGIYTMMSTNGSLLHRRNLIERLIESGLDEIIFSIDGLTQDTYEVYRVGGQLTVVVENMKTLRRRRDELHRKKPRIIMQWLPMKHNQHEIPRLRSTARAWGADEAEIKTTQVYSDAQAEKFLPEMKELRRYERKGSRWETKRRYQSCKRLWFSVMIDWNGAVVPCCFDKDEDFKMGNALAQEFDEIWHSAEYNRFRRKLLRDGRTFEMCRNCAEGLKGFYLPLARMEKISGSRTDCLVRRTANAGRPPW
jgi:radical SAM protein with 4Fe4S-binding SPASM domain